MRQRLLFSFSTLSFYKLKLNYHPNPRSFTLSTRNSSSNTNNSDYNQSIDIQSINNGTNSDNLLNVKLLNGHELKLNVTWLRHQCRCTSCFNTSTHQTNIKLTRQLLNTRPLQIQKIGNDKLFIIWDDSHESEYGINQLENVVKNYFMEYKPNLLTQVAHSFKPKTTTNTAQVKPNFPTPAIDYYNLIQSNSKSAALTKLLTNLLHNAHAFVKNCPITVEHTENVANLITHLQRTMFGDGVCVVNSNHTLEYKDTAYTNIGLDLHTDNTYFREPMGLEIFHCLSHKGQGGESSFADGFQAAELLYNRNPIAYKILSTTPVLYQYFDTGKQFYSCIDTVLGHCKVTGELERIKFNMSDMQSPIHTNITQLQNFYESLLEFYMLINANVYWIKLQPGNVIIFNNWRILHGRNGFNGERVLVTLYLGHCDWLSKARIMGVL